MRNAGHPRRIDEETVCVDALVHCLKHKCGCRSVSVTRGHSDPPDYWCIVDSCRFAVEVTSIVSRSETEYLASLKALERVITDTAKRTNDLDGAYVLAASRHPSLPPRRSRAWQQIVAEAVRFISDTRHIQKPDPRSPLTTPTGDVTIIKISNKGARVGTVGPATAKWEGEIHADLSRHMQEAITAKRNKLKRNNVAARCEHIVLAFYDAYGYGEIEDARKAFSNVDGYSWLHSVFWVASFTKRQNQMSPKQPGRYGVFLHSKNGGWMKATETI